MSANTYIENDFDRLLESGDEQAITAMIDTKQAAQNEAKANMEYLLNVGMHDHAKNEKARYDLLGRQIDRLLAALQNS